MRKSVLGNDPFQRGAAERPPAPARPLEGAADGVPVRPRKRTSPAARPPGEVPAEVSVRRPKRPAPHASASGAAASTTGAPAATRTPRRASAPPVDARPAPTPGLDTPVWSVAQSLIRVLRTALGTAGSEALDVYGKDHLLGPSLAPLVAFLYDRWFRVRVEGAEHVPAGGALLVANHAGAFPLDGPVLHAALRRERPDLPSSRWLVEDQIFYAPLLGTLLNRLGAVRASPENATRLLAEGIPVWVFPEGIQGLGKPFSERHRLKRFGRGGFVKVALRAGVPILPVAVLGAEESLPLLAKLPGDVLGLPYIPVSPFGPVPLPARWSIRIGPPSTLPTPEEAERDPPRVAETVEQTRAAIEEMLEALLRQRPAVF